MNIDFTQTGETLTVALDGRLDTTTAPELEAFLEKHCDGIQALQMDCEKLAYVSSAGLRVLLLAQKKMRGSMKLTHVGDPVMEVFTITGFSEILGIE